MKFPEISRNNLEKTLLFVFLYVVTFSIIAATLFIAPHSSSSFPLLHITIIFFASVLFTKYILYMLISPWHDAWSAWTKKLWQVRNPNYHPLVSVLIPAWNEEVGIISTVDSLIKNTYDNLEIVIINDGSSDGSDKLIRAYKKRFDALTWMKKKGKSIVYRYQENAGKGHALNHAIDIASGDILMSIDADCVVLPDTIHNFVEYFRNPNVMAAVGNVKVGNTSSIIGLIQYMEFLFSFYFKKGDSVMNTIYIIGGAAGAFRREVFTELGMYNTKNITEDIELSMRIQDAGMRIVYAADAIVYTEGAADIRSLIKQRLRWKQGRFQTFRDHVHMFFGMRSQHNKLLTCLLLPLAMFSELQLMLEFWFLSFLYVYAFAFMDFSSFVSGILVVSSMFVVQMLFDDKQTRHFSFFILAPIAWLLFYCTTFVEVNALVRSLWGFLRKKEVIWQRWERKGALN